MRAKHPFPADHPDLHPWTAIDHRKDRDAALNGKVDISGSVTGFTQNLRWTQYDRPAGGLQTKLVPSRQQLDQQVFGVSRVAFTSTHVFIGQPRLQTFAQGLWP